MGDTTKPKTLMEHPTRKDKATGKPMAVEIDAGSVSFMEKSGYKKLGTAKPVETNQ